MARVGDLVVDDPALAPVHGHLCLGGGSRKRPGALYLISPVAPSLTSPHLMSPLQGAQHTSAGAKVAVPHKVDWESPASPSTSPQVAGARLQLPWSPTHMLPTHTFHSLQSLQATRVSKGEAVCANGGWHVSAQVVGRDMALSPSRHHTIFISPARSSRSHANRGDRGDPLRPPAHIQTASMSMNRQQVYR